jgi:hypothetical protein
MKHYAVKTLGSGGIAPPFLTSVLDGNELSALRPCRFTPGETGPSTHWIGGWVGLSVGLDIMEKYLNSARNRTKVIKPVARHYTDGVIPALQRRVTRYDK